MYIFFIISELQNSLYPKIWHIFFPHKSNPSLKIYYFRENVSICIGKFWTFIKIIHGHYLHFLTISFNLLNQSRLLYIYVLIINKTCYKPNFSWFFSFSKILNANLTIDTIWITAMVSHFKYMCCMKDC